MTPEMPVPRKPFPLRLFIWVIALVFASSGGGFLSWYFIIAPHNAMERMLTEKDERISDLERETEQLTVYLMLLKHTERRARLEVLARERGIDGRTVNSIRFTEIYPDGTPLGPSMDLKLPGDEIYLDTLVIKFEDHFIEEGDPLKGRALLILRRLFTNIVPPDSGVRLDKEGVPPEIYAANTATTGFEKELWWRFWEIANNEKLAKERGIKAMHGQAVYGKLEPGRIYHLVMRSTGELILPPPTTP